MKKYLKTFLCSMICLLSILAGISASAAPSMQMQWRGDYSDNQNQKLVVSFTSPAPYIQQVSVVLYPDSVTNPTLADYVRMKEITVDGSNKTDVKFDITNNFTAVGGAYKLALQSSGYMQDTSSELGTVYVITPSDVRSLLGEFSVATQATMGDTIDKVSPALQLSPSRDAEHKAKRIASIFNIKTTDFNGSFETLEDVRDAWEITDVIVYVSESSSTAQGLKEYRGC